MSGALCVTAHADDIQALPTLRLCSGCRDGLTRDLRALPRLHADLEGVLATGSAPGTGYVTGTPSQPLPINPAVADHRDQIRHDLTWWTLYVAEHRGLSGLPSDTVPQIAAWLGRHIDWIAAHPAAAEECPPVMQGLVGRAIALTRPSGARRIEIGPCRDTCDGEPCTGRLWATVRRDDDPRPSVIYCDGPCGSERGADEWRRFGREYLREGRMAG